MKKRPPPSRVPPKKTKPARKTARAKVVAGNGVGRSRPRSQVESPPASRPGAPSAPGVKEGSSARPSAAPPFLVAAVGASAGGLEAFTALLRAIPGDAELALLLVQHLASDEVSHLPELLGRQSALGVATAQDRMPIEPRHVYVIPPSAMMTVRDGQIHLQPRVTGSRGDSAVDQMFFSVAQQYGDRGIAVVLSGGGMDGVAGLREVKAAGGISFAQTPDEAVMASMPSAAIAAGVVDAALPAEKIAEELVRLSQHPFFREVGDPAAQAEATDEGHLRRIFHLLRRASGVDFSQYKVPTIARRIERRIALNRLPGLGDYPALLQKNSKELDALQEDLLIHVTSFFRDPDSYETLRKEVLPLLTHSRSPDAPLRVWIPGCSTGEEAYSTAIVLHEFLAETGSGLGIQIFGTDVSERAVEQARSGIYPESIAADVAPDKLRRHFVKVPGGYRVNKILRDLCVFARQDLTRDAPFSKLDLVICRNLLIYLDAAAQRKIMTVLHYALKPSGYLILGRSETVGPHTDLFAVVDKRFKVYSKKRVNVRPEVDFRPTLPTLPGMGARLQPVVRAARSGEGQAVFQSDVTRFLLDRYAPAGVVVDGDFRIVSARGPTSDYLQLPAGEASLDILKMVRPGLLSGLRAALQTAGVEGAGVRKDGLRFSAQDTARVVSLEVTPVGPPEHRHFLVLFEEGGRAGKVSDKAAGKRGGKGKGDGNKGQGAEAVDRVVSGLEDELTATREHLQSIIHDLAAANEELQSANEEILSSNEELQSTNEELDTAKEELQSTNEELSTLNDELEGRNREMTEVNSDLMNLLASVQIAIVIVGADLRIRRFTPAAERALNLIPSDLGRPIGHIKPNIVCPDLEQLIREVIETMTTCDREVEDHERHLFAMRVRPYKNVESKLDGAVLTLFDVSNMRDKTDDLRIAQVALELMLASSTDWSVLLDEQFKVVSASRGFCDKFGLALAAIKGCVFYDIGAHDWDIQPLRDLLGQVVLEKRRGRDQVLEHDFPRQGRLKLQIDARSVEVGVPGRGLVQLVMREVI